MTIFVPIKEAKNRLSELARLVDEGERIVITKHGVPAFELAPPRKGGIDFEALERWKEERGLPNFLTGPLTAAFDDPLPEDFLITPLNYPGEISTK